MSSSIVQKRINWIDWAKAIAITIVVFGHIPEDKNSFLMSYILQFHMPLFFFISGFLTKEEVFSVKTLKKYWHNLIIPYFCYNIIYLPYWTIRHLSESSNINWYDIYKPILGTLFMQHESYFCEPLNGATWFIAVLLVFKIFLSICNLGRRGKYLIIFMILLCSSSYIINEEYRFLTSLPSVGLLRCLPFFFLGYYANRKQWIMNSTNYKDSIKCFFGFSISVLAFLISKGQYSFLVWGFIYWIICLFAIWGFFSLCKMLDHIHSHVITNLSIGTIVILGFHWILIGTTNYTLAKILHSNDGIKYQWYTAIFLSIAFVTILYPIIILFIKKAPFMLGKSSLPKQTTD